MRARPGTRADAQTALSRQRRRRRWWWRRLRTARAATASRLGF